MFKAQKYIFLGFSLVFSPVFLGCLSVFLCFLRFFLGCSLVFLWFSSFFLFFLSSRSCFFCASVFFLPGNLAKQKTNLRVLLGVFLGFLVFLFQFENLAKLCFYLTIVFLRCSVFCCFFPMGLLGPGVFLGVS